jgi:hypothetical protein
MASDVGSEELTHADLRVGVWLLTALSKCVALQQQRCNACSYDMLMLLPHVYAISYVQTVAAAFAGRQ